MGAGAYTKPRAWTLLAGISIVYLAGVAGSAAAEPRDNSAEGDDLKATVEALQERNRLLEKRLSDLESKVDQSPEAPAARQAEIRGLIDQALAENKDRLAPSWLKDLKFSGDLRLRYATARRSSSGSPNDSRARFRLRFGFEKAWPEEDLIVGFRLASGADEDPTSTNQTMENMFAKKPIWIDRAWARWAPKQVKGLSVTAGKMQNPFISSDILWDNNVSPEGAWAEYRYPGLGPFEPFVGAGVFQLGFRASGPNGVPTASEPVLDAYDAGFRWNVTKDVKWTSGATFYNWSNVDQEFLRYGFFNARARGNTVTGGQFSAQSVEQVNFTNVVDFRVYNVPVSVYGDWVRNMDASRLPDTQIRDTSRKGFVRLIDGPDTRKEAWALGFRVGENKRKGDWSFRYKYAYIQSDAVVGYFADADFGFANRKGNVYGVQYNITDYLTAGFDLYYTGPIFVPTIRNNTPNFEHQFSGNFDLVWKF